MFLQGTLAGGRLCPYRHGCAGTPSLEKEPHTSSNAPYLDDQWLQRYVHHL